MSRIRFRGRSKAFQTVSSFSYSARTGTISNRSCCRPWRACPRWKTAGIKQLINGPESFTPDGNFILGEAPEVRGFYVGAGFNAFGIASAGGAGRALAEWIAAGEPPMDLWPVDIRRFGRHHRSERWVRTRTLEAYAKHYTMAWPFEEYRSARPLRVSPLYPRLKDQGACFGEKLGWERPNWFAPPGVEPKDIYTYGRQNWFPYVATEHQACRERVALFDQTSFAKFLLTGKDAERALQWICANDVGKPPGSLTYTQMLNARGGIECDLTVARLSANRVLHCYRHGVRHPRLRLDSHGTSRRTARMQPWSTSRRPIACWR